jgi:hypothetical protein
MRLTMMPDANQMKVEVRMKHAEVKTRRRVHQGKKLTEK